jgi:hypothetical protein
MITRILDGEDKAKEEGYASYRQRMERLHANGKQWRGEITDVDPVAAEIDYGRWIAKCECGGAEYVSAQHPYFFCFSCGNEQFSGKARRVTFPEVKERKEIEAALLERDQREPGGEKATQAALHARPTKLPRNWTPGTTVTRLRLEAANANMGQE